MAHNVVESKLFHRIVTTETSDGRLIKDTSSLIHTTPASLLAIIVPGLPDLYTSLLVENSVEASNAKNRSNVCPLGPDSALMYFMSNVQDHKTASG